MHFTHNLINILGSETKRLTLLPCHYNNSPNYKFFQRFTQPYCVRHNTERHKQVHKKTRRFKTVQMFPIS